MVASDAAEQRFDLAIVLGTGLALYWSLYVQPLNGEILALALGSVPVVYGLYRYVPSEGTLVQGLLGLLAVVLGGLGPPSILNNSPAGRWLVGSSPLPLSLGAAIVVVLCVLVVRRTVQGTIHPIENTSG